MSEQRTIMLRPYELRLALETIYQEKERLMKGSQNNPAWGKETVDRIMCQLALPLGSKGVDKEIMDYLDKTPCILGRQLKY